MAPCSSSFEAAHVVVSKRMRMDKNSASGVGKGAPVPSALVAGVGQHEKENSGRLVGHAGRVALGSGRMTGRMRGWRGTRSRFSLGSEAD